LQREILIPLPVIEEISRRGANDITVKSVAQATWLKTVQPPPIPAAIQAWDLGLGESSLLAYAQAHVNTLTIMDDLAARRCAASLNIDSKGTLGIVLLAKNRDALLKRGLCYTRCDKQVCIYPIKYLMKHLN